MDVLKIVPSPEELQITGSLSQDRWQCSEYGCCYVATNASTLALHKCKSHNIKSHHKSSSSHVQYHCPAPGCNYSSGSGRFFKRFDILKTHYMKLHSEKKFSCLSCSKIFGLERDCHRHEAECGQTFSCTDCNKLFSNTSAYRRHCDYNQHTFRWNKPRSKSEKVKKSKPKSAPHASKRKKVTKSHKKPAFILPKPPASVQSLPIQTDFIEHLLFISKLPLGSSISQEVQTVDYQTKSAAIQTTFEGQSRMSGASSFTQRLSTGIQTTSPVLSKLTDNLRVAQTQTAEPTPTSFLPDPIRNNLHVHKEASAVSGSLGKRKNIGLLCGVRHPTFSSSDKEAKKGKVSTAFLSKNSIPPDEVLSDREQKDLLTASTREPVSTMSTQTHLSCVSTQIFPKLCAPELDVQLQDCHTQTHGSHRLSGHLIPSRNLSQGCLDKISTASSDQITQTKPCHFSNDQNTQTFNLHVYFNSLSHFVSTPNSIMKKDEVFPTFQFYPDQKPGVYEVGIDQGTNNLLISSSMSSQNAITNKDELFPFQISPVQKQDLHLDGSGVEASTNLDTKGHMPSGECASNVSNWTRSDSSSESNLEELSARSSDDDRFTHKPVACMETQTQENLGMDSMTQTVADLGWDMGTQTLDFSFADMMTQTGDELLNLLTSDIHTQTLSDFCQELLCEHSNTASNSTEESAMFSADKRIDFHELLKGQGSSSNNLGVELTNFDNKSSVSGILLCKDVQQGRQKVNLMSDQDTGIADSVLSVSDIQNKLWNDLELTWSDLGKDSETQTVYDPLFSYVQYEESSAGANAASVKYLESTHTQTSVDPMLPCMLPDEDTQSSPFRSVLAPKEWLDAQTTTDSVCLTERETAECQTPWDYLLVPEMLPENETQDFNLL